MTYCAPVSTPRTIATAIGFGASAAAYYSMCRQMLSCAGIGCMSDFWFFVAALILAFLAAMAGDTLLVLATLFTGLGVGAVLEAVIGPRTNGSARSCSGFGSRWACWCAGIGW
jgi:uncharacterized membrane protein